MAIIECDYSERQGSHGLEGVIRLWPAPTPLEGRELAAAILEHERQEFLEERIDELKGEIEDKDDEIDDLEQKKRRIERAIEDALEAEDMDDMKKQLEELLRDEF